jgi:hypothetical protein
MASSEGVGENVRYAPLADTRLVAAGGAMPATPGVAQTEEERGRKEMGAGGADHYGIK